MEHANKNISTIIAKKIDGRMRISTLPKRFPNIYLLYENLVYRFMDSFTDTYIGGYWEFMELDNGGFYMMLNTDKTFDVTVESNFFHDVLSADALSVVVNLYALCHLANKFENLDYLSDQYYFLEEFAREHEDAGKILSAID